MRTKSVLTTVLIAWAALILTVFFIPQPSGILEYRSGIFLLVGTIMYALIFIVVGMGVGYSLLGKLWNGSMAAQRLAFSSGLGLGLMGLMGFGLAGLGLANKWLMLLTLAGILTWLLWKGYICSLWHDFLVVRQNISNAAKFAPRWILWIVPAFFLLSLMLSLGPRTEAFDSLSYHLAAPQWWLRDGGIASIDMLQYWFPSLMEGMFVWPLSLGLDIVPQVIHLTFAVTCALLIWDWSRLKFGDRAAWWSIVFFLGMPSVPLLATWAYTDFGLVFYSLAALVALANWSESSDQRWMVVCGCMTGFALGIKYTSFILPVTIFLCLAGWFWRTPRKIPWIFGRFAGMTILAGFPWYLRNLLWTGNPVYPFIFGGAHWDSFRAHWLANLGSGIGWGAGGILALPFVTTIGMRDRYYIDGRIGPFYLILFPVLLMVFVHAWKNNHSQFRIFMFPVVFFSLSTLFWTLGVIQSKELFQARLLWPALIPLLPLMAAGVDGIEKRTIPLLNFAFSTLAGVTLLILLLEFFVVVVRSTPIRETLGLESRTAYMSRTRPDYAQAVSLVNQTPPDSFVYVLYEPRSYGMNRRVQPDAILDNLAHDLYLYKTNANLLNAWKDLGYTHVLIRKSFLKEDESVNNTFPEMQSLRIRDLVTRLKTVAETEDFILFSMYPLK